VSRTNPAGTGRGVVQAGEAVVQLACSACGFISAGVRATYGARGHVVQVVQANSLFLSRAESM
jgi:hypothetical protein